MHIAFECKILRRGKRHSRRRYSFYRRVVCKIHKQHRPVYCSRFTEIGNEIVRLFKRYPYRGKHNGKLASASQYFCLSGYLRRKFRMRQSRCGKHGKFLSSYQCIQSVYRAYSRLYEFVGIISRYGVYRLSVDIYSHLRDYRRSAVLGPSHSVKYPSEHIFAYGEFYSFS